MGKSISSVEDIKPGSILETRLHKGTIFSKVEQITKTMTKEKISYSDAMAEIEAILEKIEGGKLDCG